MFEPFGDKCDSLRAHFDSIEDLILNLPLFVFNEKYSSFSFDDLLVLRKQCVKASKLLHACVANIIGKELSVS